MSLEGIEKHIKQEEKERVRSILSAAKKKYYLILANSAKKVEKTMSDNSSKMKFDMNSLFDAEVNAAKAEAEKRYNLAFSEKLNEISKNTEKVLGEFVETENYKELLKKLVNKAHTELGEETSIYVKDRDLELVKSAFPNLKVSSTNEKFIGGVKAMSKDGSMGVDLTLKELLRRNNDVLIANISKRIEET